MFLSTEKMHSRSENSQAQWEYPTSPPRNGAPTEGSIDHNLLTSAQESTSVLQTVLDSITAVSAAAVRKPFRSAWDLKPRTNDWSRIIASELSTLVSREAWRFDVCIRRSKTGIQRDDWTIYLRDVYLAQGKRTGHNIGGFNIDSPRGQEASGCVASTNDRAGARFRTRSSRSLIIGRVGVLECGFHL